MTLLADRLLKTIQVSDQLAVQLVMDQHEETLVDPGGPNVQLKNRLGLVPEVAVQGLVQCESDQGLHHYQQPWSDLRPISPVGRWGSFKTLVGR